MRQRAFGAALGLRRTVELTDAEEYQKRVGAGQRVRVDVQLDRVAYDRPMDAAVQAHWSELLAPARARLAEFATYEEDWDSYGAAPIAPAAITTASYLMHRVLQRTGRAPFFVGPIPYGGIEVEYRGGERRIDVDVRPDETFDVLLVRGQGVEAAREARSSIPLTDVLRLIGDVVGG